MNIHSKMLVMSAIFFCTGIKAAYSANVETTGIYNLEVRSSVSVNHLSQRMSHQNATSTNVIVQPSFHLQNIKDTPRTKMRKALKQAKKYEKENAKTTTGK